MKSFAIALASLVIAAATGSAFAQSLPPTDSVPGEPPFRRSEILVQFKSDVTDMQIKDAFRIGALTMIKHVRTAAMEHAGEIGVTRCFTDMPVPAAAKLLSALPGIRFAEPNWIVRHDADSNDPLYLDGSLWGMYSDDQPSPAGPAGTTSMFGARAEKAWAAGYTGSKDVFVGVIDEGIQIDHPDLAANIWTNPGEIPNNGIDDDGDGYIDDIHGWNALNDNGVIYDPGYDDHGTHVSGTIGGIGGNGTGVAGVNWNVSLISGKFLDRNGSGSALDAAQAIDYMVMLKTQKGLNIVALNNSWGGGAFSQTLLDSITRAAQANIVFVAAAGNDTNDMDVLPHYPAAMTTVPTAGFESVVSVAAINSSGQKRISSNWGATNVDLGAPGDGIVSTVPVNGYASYNGTSMATPHVTGAAALFASLHPGIAAAQLRDSVLGTTAPTPSLDGITATGGRLDVGGLMSIAPTTMAPPAAPASVQATINSSQLVVVSWTDQSQDELGFAIERSSDGQVYTVADTVGANIASYTDTTATPGQSFYYRVKAYNPGAASDYVYAPSPVTVPIIRPPAAPASLAASALKTGISLSWVDKSSNEQGFTIERKIGSGAYSVLTTVGANVLKYTDSTTASRTSYTYRLRAFNRGGYSAYSNTVSVRSR